MATDSVAIVTLFNNAKTKNDSSTVFLEQAAAIAQKSKSVIIQSVYLALLGKNLLYSGNLDAADSVADIGLQLPYRNDTIPKGKFYNLKGNIAGLKKNVYQSIAYYLLAEKIFNLGGDSAAVAGIYSNIANSYFSLKDYASANRYATNAYSLLPSVKDPNIATNITITFAISLNKIGRNSDALVVVKRADSLADATHNKMAKLTTTIGLAEVYNAHNVFDTATIYYQKSIDMSRVLGVKHFELMSMMGLLAINEEMMRYGEVLQLSGPTVALASQLQNVDVLHTAKRITGKAYGKLGQYRKGFELLVESYALYDSVAGVDNQKNINELLVKYDSEKQEKEILNQNLLLAEQQISLRNRQGVILGLAAGLAILLLVIFFVRRLNKERLIRHEVEKQKIISNAYIYGEQKERTRLAYEIHDGIASMLTGISYKLRGGNVNKEEIIDLLSSLHEDTRRISHSLMPIDFERKNIVEILQNLCEKMGTRDIEVLFTASAGKVALDNQKSLLLYRIIQELINNALKHAQCQSIFVRMQARQDELNITVEDDGIGIVQSHIETGFRSIKERVGALNGGIVINSVMQEGATIKITFPYE